MRRRRWTWPSRAADAVCLSSSGNGRCSYGQYWSRTHRERRRRQASCCYSWWPRLDHQRERSLQLRPVLEPDAQGEATALIFLFGCPRYCWWPWSGDWSSSGRSRCS
ncbi:hypothetical protein PR003_g3744 [Phytophthora rubi]|uniref:Uncharacterized protein n=1 Tax=Phytophthora rubi TaxID=129364 RepID=A0A6A4FP43_9STRA|nr:hypothetical protein PR003_g3744 [Phytophthora rubi]